MTIEFNCEGCQFLFRVPDTMAGRKGRCPKCGAITPIPDAPAASPVSADLPPARPAPGPRTDYDDRGRDDYDDRGRDDYDDQPRRRRKKKSKKGLILGLSIGAALLLLVGVGLAVYFIWFAASGLGDDAKYMPSNSKLIMSVKVEELLTSKVWKDLKKEFPALDAGEAMANGQSPVALADIERITIGGDPAGDEFVVVLRLKKPVKAADYEGKLPGNIGNVTFKDKKAGKYTMREPEDDSFDLAYCQVDPKLVLFGNPKGLKAVLERDKPAKFNSVIENALKETDFSRTFAMVIDAKAVGGPAPGFVPPPPQGVPKRGGKGAFWEGFEQGFRQGAGGFNPLAAMGVDGMGFSVKVSSDVAVKMTFVFKDSSTASKMRNDMQKGLREVKRNPGMGGAPPEAQEIANSASVGGSGVNVTLAATVKLKTILSLVNRMKGMMGGF
jgi:hypothetical protein